jgi:hypothetical protein
MTCAATYDDANLILRLYDMRREPRLREARAWYGSTFKAKDVEEAIKLCPPGSEESASFRMVITYWEMVASFVTSGVLNQELFFQSGREILFVWVRISHLVPAMRETFYKDSSWLHNMETVAKAYIEYWKKQDAGAYDEFETRVRG